MTWLYVLALGVVYLGIGVIVARMFARMFARNACPPPDYANMPILVFSWPLFVGRPSRLRARLECLGRLILYSRKER